LPLVYLILIKNLITGYRYGMIATKIFLINLLRTHRVNCATSYENLKVEITMVLNFPDGYKASLSKRH
jgi:hypothetical protein